MKFKTAIILVMIVLLSQIVLGAGIASTTGTINVGINSAGSDTQSSAGSGGGGAGHNSCETIVWAFNKDSDLCQLFNECAIPDGFVHVDTCPSTPVPVRESPPARKVLTPAPSVSEPTQDLAEEEVQELMELNNTNNPFIIETNELEDREEKNKTVFWGIMTMLFLTLCCVIFALILLVRRAQKEQTDENMMILNESLEKAKENQANQENTAQTFFDEQPLNDEPWHPDRPI